MLHYGGNLPLVGDATTTLEDLVAGLREAGHVPGPKNVAWQAGCAAAKAEWEAFQAERYAHPTLHDPVWGRPVLTQPAAIGAALSWAKQKGVRCFFDAGGVQANGFQAARDDHPGCTFTETGASYMGFAVPALLATAMTSTPFHALAHTGDGSFAMNPQVLIDGAALGARGTILLLDNRRMAAISSLQRAQYGVDFATCDLHPVDWIQWASSVSGVRAFDGGDTTEAPIAALEAAHSHEGISLVHVPVYWGDHPLGGFGAFGRWNVGIWVEQTQLLRHTIGL